MSKRGMRMSFLGENIGKLGFGLMRLPMNDKEINIEQTKQMVDMFMDAGFTYFDTAWAYEGSEAAIRQALVERYPRESYQLASKCAAWIKCKTREDAINQFETSLKQAGVEYFDYYLLHNLGAGRTKVFEDFDLYSWGVEMKKQGRIKHLGFSSHGTADELEDIINKHPEMEFCQIQINYADWENPVIQCRKCYEVCRAHNLPIIIMEPVKGGILANPPQPVKDVFDKSGKGESYAAWALRYAADLEGVITVLSGMSSVEQMEENIRIFRDFNGLSDDDRNVLEEARKVITSLPTIPCTNCKYCQKVCPQNVGIAGTMAAMNSYIIYDDKKKAKSDEGWLVKGHGFEHATECIKCGACEEACPQQIKIMSELERFVDTIIPDKKKA